MNDLVSTRTSIDWAAVRRKLAADSGREYWRGLEELAHSEEFARCLEHEFPHAPWDLAIDRRRFLQLMGASLALAGMTGCTRQPEEKIAPFVRQPEEFVDGEKLFYATAISLGGYGTGVLVESHFGRPTKIEGNPLHPASRGSSDAVLQAAILGLYDPDRSQAVTSFGRISSWSSFLASLTMALQKQAVSSGAGLRLLTETVTSPTLHRQIEELLQRFPGARWHQWEPCGRDNARAGARLAFGEQVETRYRFDLADVVLALDADFISNVPGCIRYAQDFAARRRPDGRLGTALEENSAGICRLYSVECTPTLTGAQADHRLPLSPAGVEPFARALARRIGAPVGLDGGQPVQADIPAKWLEAAADDLLARRGRSLVLAGEAQPPELHALAHAMNHVLGNVGKTVIYTAPVEPQPVAQLASLEDLARDIDASKVEVLAILGGNPVYNAPADLKLKERLLKVPFRFHLSGHADETSALCPWHLPEAHPLEAWSDVRAFDGTVSIVQPLILPLYGGKSAHEVLAMLLGRPDGQGHEILRDAWKSRYRGADQGGEDFEKFWRRILHDGLVAGSETEERPVILRPDLKIPPATSDAGGRGGDLEVIFRPDPTVHDGRFANVGWLQELPKPHTRLTWDNAAIVSPGTAERLSLQNEEVVELKLEGRTVRAPVWILPGQTDGCVTVHLGYGRTRAGRVGSDTGFNGYALRGTRSLWHARGLALRKTGTRHPLACTQIHHSMEGRHLVRSGTVADFRERPDFARSMAHEPNPSETLYPLLPGAENGWGMAIDLTLCNGCNACVVACQAENNIPIVGKAEVAKGREMHWIRIDRYFVGKDLRNPEVRHQPLPCMHCENAPCEVVCPVGATLHSNEGLNEMVYNRCVGTRYCSNNCPYKVRRFNFLAYTDLETPSLKLMRNPEVTVRTRGVMEKCTYCVQRINETRIRAKKEGRPIGPDEVVTACQGACPARAISFGDIRNARSQVSEWKASPRSYGLLAELNTRPRTSYLAKVTNPNPSIQAEPL